MRNIIPKKRLSFFLLFFLFPMLASSQKLDNYKVLPNENLEFKNKIEVLKNIHTNQFHIFSDNKLNTFNSDSYIGWDGHYGSVNSVSINKAGTMIASGGSDGVIKIWDVTSGNILNAFLNHSSSVLTVAFSPDGLKLASSGYDRTIIILDVATGSVLKTLSGHTEEVYSVVFSPDGSKIASCSGGFPDFFGNNDYTVKIWDVSTGTLLRTLRGHTCIVYSVAFSPDGTKIVSSAGSEPYFMEIFDNSIRVWDSNNGNLLKTIKGHTDEVYSVNFSPDGTKIASGSADAKIKFWDANTGNLIRTLAGHKSSVNSVVFSPDGINLASGSSDTTIKIWEVSTGNFLRTLSGHQKRINSVVFSPDGMKIISGSDDNTIKIWNASAGSLINQISSKHTLQTSSIYYSPDGTKLITRGSDNTVKIWNASDGSEIRSISSKNINFNCSAISEDGTKFATGNSNYKISLWNINTGLEIKLFVGHTSSIKDIDFSPDGSKIVSGSDDKTVKVWDISSGTLIKSLNEHKDPVYCVAFSPDGLKVASAGGAQDHTIRIWDLDKGMVIGTLSGHALGVASIDFSPDGKRLLSIGYDELIKVWDQNTYNLQMTLIGHTGYVNDAKFSPDGKLIGSCEDNGTIVLWNLETGNIKRTINFDHGFASSLSFSPNGQKIASAGWGYKNIRTYNLNINSARIILSDSVLSFAAVQNGTKPSDQSFKINNKGDLTLDWSISDDAAWLDINPVNGKDSGLITVSINTTNLNPGTYKSVITISASASENSPQKINVTFLVRPSYPSTLNINRTIEFTAHPNIEDYKSTDYKLIGLPGKSDLSVKDFFSGTQGLDWLVFWDNGAESNYFKEYDGTSIFIFSVGQAFWILKRDPLVINKSINSAPVNSSYEVEIPLHSGWNLITNPFLDAISWSKVKSANSIQDPIWKFNNKFDTSSSFDPFNGYYFDNRLNLTKLKIPFGSQFFSLNEDNSSDKSNWQLNIILQVKNETYNSLWLGVSRDASNFLDKFDLRKPRSIDNIANIYFNREIWGKKYKYLASDIRSNYDDLQVWSFEITDLETPAKLYVSDIRNVPSHFGIYLLDIINNKYFNLRKDTVYNFICTDKHKFDLLIGKESLIKERISSATIPKDFVLGNNYPNPFNLSTEIPVSIHYTSEIILEVFNLLGAVVKTIYKGNVDAGKYIYTWDGKDNFGMTLSSGVYVSRLSIKSGVRLSNKMILIK